ncbi:MAG: hypothetical protein JRG90_02495 [Deltaproteobacteria bacterium]|nr:hypothetical protein [Deltaproteobacteria bacterium]
MLRILLAAVAFGTAAHAAETAEPVPGKITTIPCFERAAAVAYLHRFQDQIMLRWVIPEDTISDQMVAVRFRLSEDGNVAAWKLLSWTNRRIANSVELAFRHATSPGPIPEPAICLVDRMVEMHFENPY